LPSRSRFGEARPSGRFVKKLYALCVTHFQLLRQPLFMLLLLASITVGLKGGRQKRQLFRFTLYVFYLKYPCIFLIFSKFG
jgi:hypothetical protein